MSDVDRSRPDKAQREKPIAAIYVDCPVCPAKAFQACKHLRNGHPISRTHTGRRQEAGWTR